MSQQHKVVYLDAFKKPFRVGVFDTKQPGTEEVLIRVKAIAINPVDWKVQDGDGYAQAWPAVLGEDLAGEVEAVGNGVTRFKLGQRVIAHALFLMTQKPENGSFAEKVLVSQCAVVPIPDNISFADASVLPLATSTAAAALYSTQNNLSLGLPLPSASPQLSNMTLLIWGGSSSCGSAGIQLARASGVKVVTTCSPRNFDLIRKLGAEPFDYNDPKVIGDLVAKLKQSDFIGAFDAIGVEESGKKCAQIISELGGGVLADVLPPPSDLPTDVKATLFIAPFIFREPNITIGKAIYEDFLPQALQSGQIVPFPEAEVVGNGLEAIEDACQKQKAGVSAKKIVVTL